MDVKPDHRNALNPGSDGGRPPSIDWRPALENWTVKETADALERGEIILVDVREPEEFHAERIRGALLYPLSTFDPAGLPLGQGKKVVLSCKSGGRSARAVEACMGAGLDVTAHMAGGMEGWKGEGMSYFRYNPASGAMEEVAAS